MNGVQIADGLVKRITEVPTDTVIASDFFEAIKLVRKEEPGKELEYNKLLLQISGNVLRTSRDNKVLETYYWLRKKSLLVDSRACFDSYMQYVEYDRPAKKRFYLPRRKVLKGAVDMIQDLVDDRLDEGFLVLPVRVGKTTLAMFLATWLIGRDSEGSNLYTAYSDAVTKALYSGVLEIIADSTTYSWQDVFNDSRITRTNAADETIDIDRDKRYPSLTCRSLGGGLNGACDCSSFLVADDLISGIEEALSVDRLRAAWFKVENNLLPRAKETAKILWIGTRWAESDPMGVRLDLVNNDEQYSRVRIREITIPALDSNDESNFDYPYKLGYSTEFYHRKRASYERNNDMASWFALFIGAPIERSGALFTPEDFTYFNGVLPQGDLIRVFMAVDPAWGGGDFVAAPIIAEVDCGDEIERYVIGVVYSDAEKHITRPAIINAIKKHNVSAARFEANKQTEEYKDPIEKELKEDGYMISITTKSAEGRKGKEARIFSHAEEIRKFIFLVEGKRPKEYQLFMQNLFSFSMKSTNKHDDAPDSLAMAVDMIFNKSRARTVCNVERTI